MAFDRVVAYVILVEAVITSVLTSQDIVEGREQTVIAGQIIDCANCPAGILACRARVGTGGVVLHRLPGRRLARGHDDLQLPRFCPQNSVATAALIFDDIILVCRRGDGRCRAVIADRVIGGIIDREIRRVDRAVNM